MPDVILKEIEDDKLHRPGLYRHKWLGEPNNMERKVYKDWNVIDEIPHEARLERIGLDFGYSNDPSSIVEIYKYNSGFILNEKTYQKGLSNKQLADILLTIEGNPIIIADSAEPKSIDEIMSYGVNILPCAKGKDSVAQGIQYVQDQRISITRRSINIVKEYRNYLWEINKEGKIINKPEHQFSHSMDAIRYGLDSYRPKKTTVYKQPKVEMASDYYGSDRNDSDDFTSKVFNENNK